MSKLNENRKSYVAKRADIGYAVSVLAEILDCPLPNWLAVKRIFKYLKVIENYEVFYPRERKNVSSKYL